MSREAMVESLATMISTQGITLDELQAQLEGTTVVITLAEHIENVSGVLGKGSQRGFKTHFERLRDGFGPQCTCRCDPCMASFEEHHDCRAGCGRCDAKGFEGRGKLPLTPQNFRTSDIEPLIELAERHAVKKAILDNRRRHKRGLGPKPTHGQGAREMCVWTLRALFRRAKDDKIMSTNPAEKFRRPSRQPTKRRALTEAESIELLEVTVSGGDDPGLDLLIVWADLELGCRTGGLISMTCGGLGHESQMIQVFEKGKMTRWQLATVELLLALQSHAVARGGPRCDPTDPAFEPDAPVLYYKDSTPERPHPLTQRRMSTLHNRVQKALPWARDILFCAHELRHTSGTIIERIAGHAVAQLHLGHAPGGQPSSTGTYVKATEAEHARAFTQMTGRRHPLAG